MKTVITDSIPWRLIIGSLIVPSVANIMVLQNVVSVVAVMQHGVVRTGILLVKHVKRPHAVCTHHVIQMQWWTEFCGVTRTIQSSSR